MQGGHPGIIVPFLSKFVFSIALAPLFQSEAISEFFGSETCAFLRSALGGVTTVIGQQSQISFLSLALKDDCGHSNKLSVLGEGNLDQEDLQACQNLPSSTVPVVNMR